MNTKLFTIVLALISVMSASAEVTGKPLPVILPAGSVLQVRLNHSVGTKLNSPGERFEATLMSPLMANGKIVAPRGADVRGIVRESHPSGRLKGRARPDDGS